MGNQSSKTALRKQISEAKFNRVKAICEKTGAEYIQLSIDNTTSEFRLKFQIPRHVSGYIHGGYFYFHHVGRNRYYRVRGFYGFDNIYHIDTAMNSFNNSHDWDMVEADSFIHSEIYFTGYKDFRLLPSWNIPMNSQRHLVFLQYLQVCFSELKIKSPERFDYIFPQIKGVMERECNPHTIFSKDVVVKSMGLYSETIDDSIQKINLDFKSGIHFYNEFLELKPITALWMRQHHCQSRYNRSEWVETLCSPNDFNNLPEGTLYSIRSSDGNVYGFYVKKFNDCEHPMKVYYTNQEEEYRAYQNTMEASQCEVVDMRNIYVIWEPRHVLDIHEYYRLLHKLNSSSSDFHIGLLVNDVFRIHPVI